MKDRFRQSMAWLHAWVGLLTGWVLFFVFVTGTAGYFQSEITRWMRPELPLADSRLVMGPEQAIEVALRHLQAAAANAEEWLVVLPDGSSTKGVFVLWREPPPTGQRSGQAHRITLSADGEQLKNPEARATGGGLVFYRMHYLFRYMPRDWAIWLVGAATMLMLLAMVTGVISHKKILTDFFTFRPGKGQRSWLDAHNLFGVLALPFFLMITYSGLVFFQHIYLPLGRSVIAAPEAALAPAPTRAALPAKAAPLPDLMPLVRMAEASWGGDAALERVTIRNPGRTDATVTLRPRHRGGSDVLPDSQELRFDAVSRALLEAQPARIGVGRVHRVLLELHQGRFAGQALRWLYFISGLLGSALIATGLVLWTAKRRRDQEKRISAGHKVAFGFRLVEALNIGTIAGLCTAVAVFFWANRLLPVGMAQRADWEFHCLFIAWGLLLLHAAVRLRFAPSLQVWREQLWLAAAAFGLLPVLNALTTDKHLGVTVPAADWALAGFDLTVLAFGLAFAFMAFKVQGKLRKQSALEPDRRPGSGHAMQEKLHASATGAGGAGH